MIRVFLSRQEVEWGARIGARRQIDSAEHKRKPRVEYKATEYWIAHIEGASAEIAVAKYLGLYCEGSSGTFESMPDLGPYQVRLSGGNWDKLMVRPRNMETCKDMSRVYIHVMGTCPAFTITGWLRVYEAVWPQWWEDPGNHNAYVYMVPRDYLHPMSTLPSIEEASEIVSFPQEFIDNAGCGKRVMSGPGP